MTQIEITLSMISPCLANSLCPADGEDAQDTFNRDADNNPILQQNQLFAMLQSAKALSNSPVDILVIRFDLALRLESPTTIFKRPYRKEGQPKIRKHESIGIGNLIRLRMFIPYATKTALADLARLLEFAGTYVGLSPYGHTMGYGKFNVISVNEMQELGVFGGEVEETFVPGAR